MSILENTMSFTLYGISTCDSCRKAKKWFDVQGIDYTWVDTRKSAPTKEQITSWIATLGNKVMRNTSGGAYRSLGEEKKTWDDKQWIEAFSNDSMLLKRPLIEHGSTAISTGFRGSDDEIRSKLGLK